MKKSILAFTILALFAVLQSCKKENNDQEDTVGRKKLNQIFAPFRETPQKFNVTIGRDTVIDAEKGTRLHFYSNSFKRTDGSVLGSGIAEITLIEMYSPGSVIRNRSTTTNDGNLLITGGQVNIVAKLAGTELKANKFGIGFGQNEPKTETMYLFYGQNSGDDSLNVWTGSGSNRVDGTGQVKDTLTNLFYYTFDSCSNFNWINCDYFYNYGNAERTNVSYSPGNSVLDHKNAQVYIVFPSLNNSITYFGLYENGKFSLAANYFIPTGLNAHILFMGYNNNEYYYEEQKNVNITSNLSISGNPQKKTIAEITTALANL